MPSSGLIWEKVSKVDPQTLEACEKDELDEVFRIFVAVIIYGLLSYMLTSQIHAQCLLSSWFY